MGWYEPEGISDAEDQLQDQIRRGETDEDLEERLERAKLIEDFDWLIMMGKLPDFSKTFCTSALTNRTPDDEVGNG